jgi:hypothetical protein
MPRPMPPFADRLRQRVTQAVALSRAGDVAAASDGGGQLRTEWHISRVELLYELSYLRMFIEWEWFLEQSFLRYLCGYVSARGPVRPTAGAFFATLPLAQAAVLGGNPYVLWHNPDTIARRSRRFLAQCPHETVIDSYRARLLDLAAVRHRIAHGQEDARQKFDVATINIAGRRYRGGRPGRFLRDWDRSVTPPRRWLQALGTELVNVAQQIA